MTARNVQVGQYVRERLGRVNGDANSLEIRERLGEKLYMNLFNIPRNLKIQDSGKVRNLLTACFGVR